MEHSKKQESSPPQWEHTPHALVVDDDMVTRLLVREAIEQSGFGVTEADDGKPAIDLFSASQPDIVLLDVLMPGLDGFDTCKALREIPGAENVPIVMMTTLDDIDSINRAFNAGATDFIIKPINFTLLERRIHHILRSSLTEAQLRSSRSRLQTAQRIARLGHWELDPATGNLRWSEGASEIFSLPGKAMPANWKEFMGSVHAEDRHYLQEKLKELGTGKGPIHAEYRITPGKGGEHIVDQKAEAEMDQAGKISRIIGTLQDITEQKQAEQKIFSLAYYDQVTGLPNREFFRAHLRQAFRRARRDRRHVSVISICINNFRHINDVLGRAAGDALLNDIADKIVAELGLDDMQLRKDYDRGLSQARIREADTLARIESSRFMLSHTGTLLKDAPDKIAGRIVHLLDQSFMVNGSEVIVTANIGISRFPEHGANPDDLMGSADTSLKIAREQGENTVRVFTDTMARQARRRISLEHDLAHALEKEQMRLMYQPIVDINSGKVTGMEALIRWQHPSLGLIMPSNFIPLAEETGLIKPLGEWVLRTALYQLRQWHDQGANDLRMSVNMSARQFHSKSLYRDIAKILSDTGVGPEFLQLEITESLLLEDEEVSSNIFHNLGCLGTTIALDDFGTGFCSLSYLKRFPIDVLKIDRSFVHDISTNKDSRAIVAAIMTLAERLEIQVVAEGIETALDIRHLAELGCGTMQGYFFSRPLDSEKLPEWLRTYTSSSNNPFLPNANTDPTPG